MTLARFRGSRGVTFGNEVYDARQPFQTGGLTPDHREGHCAQLADPAVQPLDDFPGNVVATGLKDDLVEPHGRAQGGNRAAILMRCGDVRERYPECFDRSLVRDPSTCCNCRRLQLNADIVDLLCLVDRDHAQTGSRRRPFDQTLGLQVADHLADDRPADPQAFGKAAFDQPLPRCDTAFQDSVANTIECDQTQRLRSRFNPIQ